MSVEKNWRFNHFSFDDIHVFFLHSQVDEAKALVAEAIRAGVFNDLVSTIQFQPRGFL